MVKKYGLVADKNTQNLQAELKNIKGIKLGILDEFISVRIPEDSEDIYKKVEQLFIDYSRKDNFTFSYSFGTFDVEKKDFESFDAIKVFFPVFGENDD